MSSEVPFTFHQSNIYWKDIWVAIDAAEKSICPESFRKSYTANRKQKS